MRTQSVPGSPTQRQQRQQAPQKPPITPKHPNQQHLLAFAQQQQPIQPLRKQWYDKLADALLGDDDSSTPPTSRYALICQKCFSHNGLVKESLWQDTQYVCPKCGHFNPSQRSLNGGGGGSSAASPNSSNDQSTTSLPASLHPTIQAEPSPQSQRREPSSSNDLRKRKQQPVVVVQSEEGNNSTTEMDVDES